MFDSPPKLLLGLVTGILFGVLLQKGRAIGRRLVWNRYGRVWILSRDQCGWMRRGTS